MEPSEDMRKIVRQPSEDMWNIVRQPSEDMWNIVRQFQQDVEDVLEKKARDISVSFSCHDNEAFNVRMMYNELEEAGAKMMCSIVEHLAEQGLLSILEEKTGRDYGVFCELK